MADDSDKSKDAAPRPAGDIGLPNEQSRQATLKDGLMSVVKSDPRDVVKIPCARESLLIGIVAGFVFGGIRLVFKAPVKSAANWSVGMFTITSLGSFEMCQYRREKEKEGMQRAIEVIDKRTQERDKRVKERMAREKAEREAREAAEKAAQEAANKRWWKPW